LKGYAEPSKPTLIHLALHLLVPLGVCVIFYAPRWKRTLMIMMATMCIDLDHLLADPIYDPERCSIGFHPLHCAPAICLYVLALVHPRTRVLGIGLCIHIVLDSLDCVL
jgi:hypothetical protein